MYDLFSNLGGFNLVDGIEAVFEGGEDVHLIMYICMQRWKRFKNK